MQIVNVPHPSLALFVRRVNGTQAGQYRSWEVACALGGGLAFGRTKREAADEIERAQRFGADRLTSDALLARGVLCTSRSPSAFAPEVPWCSWTAAPYSATHSGCRDALFTVKPYDLPALRGLGLGSAAMSEALRAGRCRALVETRATTRGVDPLPCVGIDDEIAQVRGLHFDRYTLA